MRPRRVTMHDALAADLAHGRRGPARGVRVARPGAVDHHEALATAPAAKTRSSRDRPRAIVPPRAAPPVGDPGAGSAMLGFVPGSPALILGEQNLGEQQGLDGPLLWLNT